MIFEGFVIMYIRITIFWVVTLCDLVVRYQRSKITGCLYFQVRKNNLFYPEDAGSKFSETAVTVYQTRQGNIPEELNLKYLFKRNYGKNKND
jgi:hypothetical protein